ncbi:Rfm1p [Lachancea thermotolerans CBS 6340]|uniref:KLTH0D12694p n=1 Tax=Lachancea thermotolerans (strain ATCC 56472 / CBS 6340 / NRRL Y-8284) TaxID=559295 RepID=C5DF70_LACTC|nr:KLTH0D12694p [Lachancea thermotolerans CBS 6340]CAR22825.1 KLTH0D12694p [Lachancea thermotolerans CBS 6340]
MQLLVDDSKEDQAVAKLRLNGHSCTSAYNGEIQSGNFQNMGFNNIPSQCDLEINMGNLTQFEQIKNKRRQLSQESAALKRNVKPIEFESYEDFFLLNKFKKGVSESGKVDVEGIKSRITGVYYEKIKRGVNGQTSDSELQSDDEKSKKNAEFRPKRRTTRSQLNKQKVLASRSSSTSQSPTPEQRKPALLDASISVNSIIPSNNSDGNIRRSSRLSQKEKEILEKKALLLERAGIEAAVPQILDLFESIVPKTLEPVRRSDWILPSKCRFIPEKFAPIKHTPEQIRINDLIHNGRIRKIMTRFKGGLAGVRKKDWELTAEKDSQGGAAS